MFCQNCGDQISGEVNFCPKCGHPQKGGSQAQAQPAEYCQITYQLKTGFIQTFQFWAQATGPRGTYNAGESATWTSSPNLSGLLMFPHVPVGNNQKHLALHAELVNKLVQDGWKPIGRGERWWQDKFQR